MSSEIELKLLIAERDVWRLVRLPILNAVTLKKLPGKRLINTYYDTLDYRLRDSGIAVRLRQSGDKWLQTVKTEGEAIAGLQQRGEWESETSANTFDFKFIADQKLKARLEKIIAGELLHAMFSTEFTRQSRVVQFNDGTQCEFAIDRGRIVAGEREAPICELELELIAGDAAALFDFVRTILESIPLRIAEDTKAARGFALALAKQRQPAKATHALITKHMSPLQGFVAIASSCVAQLIANEAGCVADADPEFLHQCRVAIRRLRTVIKIFSEHLDPKQVALIGGELQWLGQQLGVTRDLDVFLGELLPLPMAHWPEHVDLLKLKDSFIVQRHSAMAASRAALQSSRYQRLLLDMGAWLTTLAREDAHNATAAKSNDLPDFACSTLQRLHKQLTRHAERLVELSPEERHRVRVRGKRLRYAAEFFAPLFPGKRGKVYVRELANLQSVLGALNDAATTQTVMAKQADHVEASAIISAWVMGAGQANLNQLTHVYNGFLQQQKFW